MGVLLSGLKYFKLNQVDFYFLLQVQYSKKSKNQLFVCFIVSLNLVEVSCYQTGHDHTTAWSGDGCQSRLAHPVRNLQRCTAPQNRFKITVQLN